MGHRADKVFGVSGREYARAIVELDQVRRHRAELAETPRHPRHMELPLYDCPCSPLARKLVLDLVADLEAQILELLPGSLLRVDARGKARLEYVVVQVLADEDQLAHPRLVLPPFRSRTRR